MPPRSPCQGSGDSEQLEPASSLHSGPGTTRGRKHVSQTWPSVPLGGPSGPEGLWATRFPTAVATLPHRPLSSLEQDWDGGGGDRISPTTGACERP